MNEVSDIELSKSHRHDVGGSLHATAALEGDDESTGLSPSFSGSFKSVSELREFDGRRGEPSQTPKVQHA